MQYAKSTMLTKGIQAAVAAVLLSAGQTAIAANITVRVVHADSLEPVVGAAVCLGSKNEPQAYGSMRTNSSGEVIYAQAPRGNFILSVAGDGSGDYAREQTPRNFDIIYYVALDQRQISTNCLAPVRNDLQLGRAALNLTSVDVKSHSHHAGTVDVATQVNGVVPTHIRASTHADFKDAQWMPYRQVTRHEIDHVAAKDLYVQVKRVLNKEGGDVEALSMTRVGDLHWD